MTYLLYQIDKQDAVQFKTAFQMNTLRAPLVFNEDSWKYVFLRNGRVSSTWLRIIFDKSENQVFNEPGLQWDPLRFC